jgi:stage II sporulation protein D
VPGRRGATGRILDLTVEGSPGRFTFRGFNIERLLGHRETLFLVDRQYEADGSIGTFVFSGKGWGHGVGLCQIGAYGMALRGKSYEEILHHYYTGVTLEKLAPR